MILCSWGRPEAGECWRLAADGSPSSWGNKFSLEGWPGRYLSCPPQPQVGMDFALVNWELAGKMKSWCYPCPQNFRPQFLRYFPVWIFKNVSLFQSFWTGDKQLCLKFKSAVNTETATMPQNSPFSSFPFSNEVFSTRQEWRHLFPLHLRAFWRNHPLLSNVSSLLPPLAAQFSLLGLPSPLPFPLALSCPLSGPISSLPSPSLFLSSLFSWSFGQN